MRQITNSPDKILGAWLALEALSPALFKKPSDLVGGDSTRIVNLSKKILPWNDGKKRGKQNYKLYYHIVLGSIDMSSSLNELLKIYSDKRDERPQIQGESILAVLTVDSKGIPVTDNGVTVSSFGWALPIALSGNLTNLGMWPDIEPDLSKELLEKIIKMDSEGRILPLDYMDIENAYLWLIDTYKISNKFMIPPKFAVCSYQYYLSNEPPEAPLLNSFFINDLGWAQRLAKGKSLPENLLYYLGIKEHLNRYDLRNNKNALSAALEPTNFPPGAWPSNGRHPLVFLQQCAVNLIMEKLEHSGIFAVNGPPGTGKTTLLRDIIAAIITERAQIMLSYDDPEKAFKHSGYKIKRGNAFIHLYELDTKLRGYEILIASSNNKAVENISAELPLKDAIAKDLTSLRYFSTLSDFLTESDTWGIISAVLGNNKNRNKLRQKFWWDDECGLHRYLLHACGTPQFIIDDNLKQVIPDIIQNENPPENHDDALERWNNVRKKFKILLNNANKSIKNLQSIYEHYLSIEKYENKHKEAKKYLLTVVDKYNEYKNNEKYCKIYLNKQEILFKQTEEAYKNIITIKPGFFKRIFSRNLYKKWLEEFKILEKFFNEEKKKYDLLLEEYTRLCAKAEKCGLDKKNAEDTLSVITNKVNNLSQKYIEYKKEWGGVFIDKEFYKKNVDDQQKSVPWFDKDVTCQRMDVFAAAMMVHKAFIDCAAKPIRHNLNAFFDSFGMKSLGDTGRDLLIPELWSTFFIVVPAVSTTFASVRNMLCNIKIKELGWLLVDEAGQALPQAAVGSIMRAKKVVVVGDPVQIEPVVILPEDLTNAICLHFNIDPLLYNAPQASVQTLADKATPYFATFESKNGTREVGAPLLVHRRCSEPMFEISNCIAYAGAMVNAKNSKDSPIKKILGFSKWIDVRSSGNDKWSEKEGKVLVSLLEQLKKSGVFPDFYIITPFVVVQDNMRKMLKDTEILEDWVDNPNLWVYEHVGTVHTVQGREAEAVFFILGAPNIEQSGARNWAGRTPNLLNVAVTRAKEVLYVIGNEELWKGVQHFEILHKYLKIDKCS